ncbi:GAL4-like ZnII2Cys6 or C6 zinc binuclear cluster DNA-binding domain protein [Aspergillus parasiticus SU-1]|uniref:GAL4-like ZnII2Cys6 or C6 zinc binuclear cluster DNA-binding domain protein n=1 Tax=Aspergillus parasiticus (strain ATCC 56775 / NRRL 5862 / SRRC 143 / SU-1) TaxID=1403190 RepID=A0A0F0IIY1_ASPPU|nr:GAL4-like ZnII2Cys6 or C6 zinc binuclear cluster DNA-binding domain protein [Aspergillus parasiticus SU-1]
MSRPHSQPQQRTEISRAMAVKSGKQKDVATPRLRLRKAHQKSRKGCRNCKLRRVKCDEVQPSCHQCTVYGVLCNYGPDTPDLQMAREMEDPAVISADATTTLELTREDRHQLISFEKSGTLVTIATVHHKEVLQLACLNPYLMHAILAIGAMHNRHRVTPAPRGPSSFESYHVSQCAALLSRKLSQALRAEDRDPLWMTSTLLGIISTSSIPCLTPEEAWPLKSSDTSDLEWLRMAEGKMAVWRLVDPLRPNSLFRYMADEYTQIATLQYNSVLVPGHQSVLYSCAYAFTTAR